MITYITTAHTEVLTLLTATKDMPSSFPAVEAHFIGNKEQVSSDLRKKLESSDVVILRLLGGREALGSSFDVLVDICKRYKIPIIACSGERFVDDELLDASNVDKDTYGQVFSYLIHGGIENYRNLLLFLSDKFLGSSYQASAPKPIPWEGVYHPALDLTVDRAAIQARWRKNAPTVGLLFYRATWMSGDLLPVDALIYALEKAGCNTLPVFCYSLRKADGDGSGISDKVKALFTDDSSNPVVDSIISLLSFASSDLIDGPVIDTSQDSQADLKALNVPIVQAIISSSTSENWKTNKAGLSPIDLVMKVALPEFDGRIIGHVVGFREEITSSIGGATVRMRPHKEGLQLTAQLAMRFAILRRKPNNEKKVAIILSNYPVKNGRLGNAVGLDTPASVINILDALAGAGYFISDRPKDGADLMERITSNFTNDPEFSTVPDLEKVAGTVHKSQYQSWFSEIPVALQNDMRKSWGDPPGLVSVLDNAFFMPGIVLGNIFIGIQPARGYGENPVAIYHSPDLPPTHHYLAFYGWLRNVFKADALIHVGKHGNLEWLPGKSVALSEECYPQVALQDMPLFYSFIVNNPGEGTQAKRRTHATIVDHLPPVLTTADTYGELARMERLLDEYSQIQYLDQKKLPMIESQIWKLLIESKLNSDLGVDQKPDDFVGFLAKVDGYLCELKLSQIKDGFHILGEVPEGEKFVNLLASLTRLDNPQLPSLRKILAKAFGLDYDEIIKDLGKKCPSVSSELKDLANGTEIRICGDLLTIIDEVGKRILTSAQVKDFDRREMKGVVFRTLGKDSQEIAEFLIQLGDKIVPRINQVTSEVTNILVGLNGEYIPAGPSGAPTRGMIDVLPTGRNFFSVDVRAIPSRWSWEIGSRLGDELLKKYKDDKGEFPQSIGIVIWGTSTMRTQGDDISEVFYLLGVRPIWELESGRLQKLEVIPLEELRRPRIDVTVRMSGFFRDAFPNIVKLMAEAVRMVSELDEPEEMNFVAKHFKKEMQKRIARGEDAATAKKRSLYRVFGSSPGTYGVGLLNLIHSRNWKDDNDLAKVYLTWGGYAYDEVVYGDKAEEEFKDRLREVDVAVKNQDNREHDIFDSDDYFQEHGGMIASIRALTGVNPEAYFGDSSNPDLVKVRGLKDEARRVFRTRVLNPKWIKSIMKHGYRGAMELAATIDFMFGYDATANVIDDWMYQQVAQSYLFDEDVKRFLVEKNPWAMKDMAERLLEASERGLWKDADEEMKQRLRSMLLEAETVLEEKTASRGSISR
ncbi:MAG: cobaltochelatase subunit CobN [Thaumarchaeota archaeon]|nr:cobaltochelatase subunit CobN [Nitrososphaerota archaeon]